MKWKLEEEWYFTHGDFIEFVCKPGYVLPPLVSESELLVQCNDGQLNYPQCISKGKMMLFLTNVLSGVWQTPKSSDSNHSQLWQ